MIDSKNTGFRQGHENGIKEVINKMHSNNMDIKTIARIMNLNEEIVNELLEN